MVPRSATPPIVLRTAPNCQPASTSEGTGLTGSCVSHRSLGWTNRVALPGPPVVTQQQADPRVYVSDSLRQAVRRCFVVIRRGRGLKLVEDRGRRARLPRL